MFKHKFHIIVVLFILFLAIFYGLKQYLSKSNISAATITYPKTSVTVDAFIGEYRFTLFGYSSPKALVSFEGMGIFDQTYANEAGYFEFKNRFSPLIPREACLTAQDSLGRVTAPTCLPPFPIKYDVNIGPVILSPTLSLNNPPVSDNYYMGDEIIASGQSIPNTNVFFSTFIDERKSIWNYLAWGFVKPTYAYTFPEISTKTDEKGNYSIALPSADSRFFRIFTQTEYQNSKSPESNKLNINIYPIWMIIIHFFVLFISLLKSRILELIILIESILVILFLLRRYFHPHIVAKNRALALRDGLSLMNRNVTIVEEKISIVPY